MISLENCDCPHSGTENVDRGPHAYFAATKQTDLPLVATVVVKVASTSAWTLFGPNFASKKKTPMDSTDRALVLDAPTSVSMEFSARAPYD
jgi:hypothetical protein